MAYTSKYAEDEMAKSASGPGKSVRKIKKNVTKTKSSAPSTRTLLSGTVKTKSKTRVGKDKKGIRKTREVVKTRGQEGRTKKVAVTANKGSRYEVPVKSKSKQNRKAVRISASEKVQKAINEEFKKLNK
jgi:hypothetical protein